MSVLKGCKPRRDVLHGDLDDAIFAADFGSLIAGDRCPEVYRDAGKFFASTRPAAQLKKVVQVVFGRLADTKEPGALGASAMCGSDGPPGHHAAGHKMSAMPGRSLP